MATLQCQQCLDLEILILNSDVLTRFTVNGHKHLQFKQLGKRSVSKKTCFYNSNVMLLKAAQGAVYVYIKMQTYLISFNDRLRL